MDFLKKAQAAVGGSSNQQHAQQPAAGQKDYGDKGTYTNLLLLRHLHPPKLSAQ
jgi:hypothetical protein